jgi:sugar-specific transcriptional regulator TrmB
MIPSLKKALEVLGLTEKQTLVLGVLLEGGPMLVAAIAKATKLNRTSTYDLVHELSGLGLVTRVKKEGAERYQAIDPELLPAYLERRREVLEESKRQLSELLPQLKLLRSRGKSITRVQYFEGVEGIKQAYEGTITNNHSKVMYGFLGTDAVVRLMDPSWPPYYIGKRVAQGVKAYTIAIDTPSSRHYKGIDEKHLRVTKLLPPGYDFEIELVTYDDKVLITSFSQEKPLSVLIEDEKIAELMIALFKYMDSTLP